MRLEAIALPMVRLALTEDIGGGDATTDAVVDPTARARAHIEARREGILAGSGVAVLAFRELDPEMKIAGRAPMEARSRSTRRSPRSRDPRAPFSPPSAWRSISSSTSPGSPPWPAPS